MRETTRDKTLLRLRDSVVQTKALFEGAKEEFERASDLQRDLGQAHADGTLAHATRVYTYALHYYRTAIFRYSRYLLDGRLPEDEQPEPDRANE